MKKTLCSDLMFGGGFPHLLRFPPPSITDWSQLCLNMAGSVMIIIFTNTKNLISAQTSNI